MKHFVCYMVTLFTVVFGGIALVNYTVDPGHIYYQSEKYIDDVIHGIADSMNVEGITDIDERTYKLRFTELHKGERFDYLALGSSRIMTVSEDVLHGASLLNLSISSCQIEELIAYYQICKDFDIRYKNLLITADPSLFNAHYRDDRWKILGSYVNEYMGKDVTGDATDWDLVWNLFSVSYFKTALDALLAGRDRLHYVKTVRNEGETFRTDGSFYWSRPVYEAPPAVVRQKAHTMHYHLYKDFSDLSAERTALFTRFLQDIKADGVNVILVRSPYHPIFYKNLLKMKGAVDSFGFIEQLANDNGFRMIGSFNPADEGLDETDFYDGPHTRKESFDKMIERELFKDSQTV